MLLNKMNFRSLLFSFFKETPSTRIFVVVVRSSLVSQSGAFRNQIGGPETFFLGAGAKTFLG